MKRLLISLTTAALLLGSVFAGVASAHSTTVTGVTACLAPNIKITWTITNVYTTTETVQVTSVTQGSVSPTVLQIPGSPAQNKTGVIVEQLPDTDHGSVTLNVKGMWPDNFTATGSGSVLLPTNCVAPVTTTVPKPPITTTPVAPTTTPQPVPTTVVPAPVTTVAPPAPVITTQPPVVPAPPATVKKPMHHKATPKTPAKPRPTSVTIPAVHTGEPWSAPVYFWLIGLIGLAGLILLFGNTRLLRRR